MYLVRLLYYYNSISYLYDMSNPVIDEYFSDIYLYFKANLHSQKNIDAGKINRDHKNRLLGDYYT